MVRLILRCLMLAVAATGPGAPAPAARPSQEFNSIADALKQVPAGVIPLDPDGWNDAKVDAANDALARAVTRQHITMGVIFEGAKREPDNPTTVYSLIGKSEEEMPSAEIHLEVSVDQANLLDLARLNRGDRVTLSGNAELYFFDNNGTVPPTLVVRVTSAKVVNVRRVGTTPATAPANREAQTMPTQR
jgi:hypothetical protein